MIEVTEAASTQLLEVLQKRGDVGKNHVRVYVAGFG